MTRDVADLSNSVYRFEVFELRPDERLLYRAGEPTALGARAVDVLTVLASAQGRLVSKTELLDRVWPGLVVEENNLQVQISTLRKQLGAQAITTVPGRGYRFCLPVEVATDPASASTRLPWRATPRDAAELRARQTPPPAHNGVLWGREADLSAVLGQGMGPLWTVIGQAGIGKTAFCLTLAQHWRDLPADGVAWVDLGSVSDATRVESVVAQALGLHAEGDDRLGTLVAELAGSQRLLVIDSAEHLQEPVARLAQALLRGAPRVSLLVSSQMPLRVDGERVYRLGPLALPESTDTADQVMRQGAVALFIDQVKALHRPFALDDEALACIARLCRRLDGVPLAIKLAASRVPVLGLAGVEERLAERFKLLQGRGGSAPERQQTLLAALDWSHELLSPSERAVFRRLAVVAGSFSIDLARQLASDIDLDEWAVIDILAALVDRSLVMAEGGEWPRYRLLDSMRDYALLKLREAGEFDEVCRRHAWAVADLMDDAYAAYWREADAPWRSRHGPELDNVRMALDWASAHDVDLACRLAGAAGPLFMLMGLHQEGRRRALALDPALRLRPESPARARHWLELSRLHWNIDGHVMAEAAEWALAGFRASQDPRGIYMALRCLTGSGRLSQADAWQALAEMSELEQPDWPVRLCTQRQFAEIAALKSCDRMAEARRVCQTLLVRAQAAGLDGIVSVVLCDLASTSLAMGDLDTAYDTARALLMHAVRRRDGFALHAHAIIACVRVVRQDLSGAREAIAEFVATSAACDWEWLRLYAPLLALMAALDGRLEASARLLGYAQVDVDRGVHNVLTVYAHSRAMGLVADGLAPRTLAQLQDAGRTLTPAAVATWALGHPLHQPGKPADALAQVDLGGASPPAIDA